MDPPPPFDECQKNSRAVFFLKSLSCDRGFWSHWTLLSQAWRVRWCFTIGRPPVSAFRSGHALETNDRHQKFFLRCLASFTAILVSGAKSERLSTAFLLGLQSSPSCVICIVSACRTSRLFIHPSSGGTIVKYYYCILISWRILFKWRVRRTGLWGKLVVVGFRIRISRVHSLEPSPRGCHAS